MLSAWRMRVVLADSAAAAQAAVRAAEVQGLQFSVVLVDMQMPDMDGFRLVERISSSSSVAGAVLMLLTSAGQRGDAARCRKLGIKGYLTKPIRRSDLLDALLMTLSPANQNADERALITRHLLRESRGNLQILLAEDDALNRKFVSELLEKRGFRITAVENGRQAMEYLLKSAFDLLIMDVQMPEVDGLEAARAIRRFEVQVSSGEVTPPPESTYAAHHTRFNRIPILALTARSMKGDRERCLDAGMDGYLSKPIQIEELLRTVDNMANTNRQTTVPVPAEQSAKSVLDRSDVLARVEGDMELLREIVELFHTESAKLIARIGQALASKDSSAVERTAHSLKGSLGNLGAARAMEKALILEKIGHSGQLMKADEAFKDLEEELALLKPELEALIQETDA
jgi:CheY-like chemotaxis protein